MAELNKTKNTQYAELIK